ncbi:MAG TPA: TIGR01906 family membrane protein [Candidatus Enterocloster excrementipullorum]|uniref:TIGR01906 family membrane protein n=1 Tax=Candidatus Enterocloster excrementipullorum TaxID=2838559 RepID=A0A9D2MYR8_9FIRM|nr:TIGR01906 family membrane protein [Candidatus Enterocloster excrementipullorum]
MKPIHWLAGIFTAFCLMIILLITSVEAVVYWTPGYFEREYTKYNVLDSLPSMTMEDLLEVTDEMMDYLKGEREDLHVVTVMDGQEREFFNEREIAHMEDVQVLFLRAMSLRRACIFICVLCLGFLFLTKAPVRRVLPPSICAGTGLFFGITAILALIISGDFTKYFVIFHHIFFDNDLWILDPATDMLINIVPEGFFMDTAARIALLFGASSAVLFGICLFLTLRGRSRALLAGKNIL